MPTRAAWWPPFLRWAEMYGRNTQTRSQAMSNIDITIEEGSTNVYADMGYADAAEI